MSYKYLVVDDEPLARKLILSHTEKIEGLELAGECGDAIQAGNILRSRQVDLIFLDIQLPELGGLEFIRTLRNPPAVIFTTAYRDYAPDAFDIDAVDYLIKPIAFERLVRGVNKFFDRVVSSTSSPIRSEAVDQQSILIKADRKMHKVALSDIYFIESLDDFVKVHLRDKVLVSRDNISSLEKKLTPPSFVRIHRSYIISSRLVSSISGEGVEIKGKMLPFGRAFKLSAMAALGLRAR
jgi:DNA-binding LytR/AlgR family response regulator